MKIANYLFGVVALIAAGLAATASGAELKPETLHAWDQYVRSAESRMQARLETGHQFLWIDESPGRAERVRRGEILVAPMVGHGTEHVSGGLIHHWLGAVFIPNTTIAGVLAVAHDYDHYKEIYKPKVVDSRLLACEDGRQKYSMLWLNDVLSVHAALESEYEAFDFPVDRTRWYTITHATSAREIEDYGQSGQRFLPPGQGNGFIWRLQSIVRYEERDGGVYMELEALGLTRDIPGSLRWLAAPLVARLSRSTLAASLRQTREGVAEAATETQTISACGTRNHRVEARISRSGPVRGSADMAGLINP